MNPDSLESKVRRLPLHLGPDSRRVLVRPFIPALVVKPFSQPEPNQRVTHIFSRVMLLDDNAVRVALDEVLAEFDGRHLDIRSIFSERFEQIRPMLPTDREISAERQLLLGSFFTNEYSLESSALFNPSIIAHPDQSGMDAGCLRFILSLRATGEGHISSITFRSGVLGPDCEVCLDPVSRYVVQPRPQPAARYERSSFRRKLLELGVEDFAVDACTNSLGTHFLMEELHSVVRRLRFDAEDPAVRRGAERALLLARSNYTVRFDDGLQISEKILFPFAQSESNGIEDARLVAFREDDGSITYHATYTAYDGSVVVPQLVTTRDFQEFSICTLNGGAVRNKGLALFPRKIGGRFFMLGRQDSENIHIMSSEHLHFWHDSEVILRPAEPWEFVQLGNCGSPIETPRGWLVITHGVGPMRKYCIGACLLDLENPARVLARLREPLLRPAPDERDGYVPNVVYSCGALVHQNQLVLPYAVSDTATRFAVVALDEVLDAMHRTDRMSGTR